MGIGSAGRVGADARRGGIAVRPLNERLATYKYVVRANGDWVDELYPSHKWATWHRPSAARVY